VGEVDNVGDVFDNRDADMYLRKCCGVGEAADDKDAVGEGDA
jgi:hypothetical protein